MAGARGDRPTAVARLPVTTQLLVKSIVVRTTRKVIVLASADPTASRWEIESRDWTFCRCGTGAATSPGGRATPVLHEVTLVTAEGSDRRRGILATFRRKNSRPKSLIQKGAEAQETARTDILCGLCGRRPFTRFDRRLHRGLVFLEKSA